MFAIPHSPEHFALASVGWFTRAECGKVLRLRDAVSAASPAPDHVLVHSKVVAPVKGASLVLWREQWDGPGSVLLASASTCSKKAGKVAPGTRFPARTATPAFALLLDVVP